MERFGRVVYIVCAFSVGSVSCTASKPSSEDVTVADFFRRHKAGGSPDYAVMKNGNDHLMTIHGYLDDRDVCLKLIEAYNSDPSLSVFPGTYSCVPLNR